MGKSAKLTRGGNKMRKNPIRDVAKKGDSLKVIAKKASEKLDGLTKKGSAGTNMVVKGALPDKKKARISVSKKKKCIIK